MTVFVDTSALMGVLDADDANHKPAREAWQDLITQEEILVCTNYVLVESFALVRNRLGLVALGVLQNDVLPLVQIEWVEETLHRAGVSALLTAGRRQLSLVDCISFEAMRRLGIQRAFTLDQQFSDQGFICTP
jgi:predicted nucleic acid-binding protein